MLVVDQCAIVRVDASVPVEPVVKQVLGAHILGPLGHAGWSGDCDGGGDCRL